MDMELECQIDAVLYYAKKYKESEEQKKSDQRDYFDELIALTTTG
jgi:hypothetical protein